MKHFSRIRATVQREYPDSLLFLEPALADATIAQNDQSRVIETFLTNPSADEVDVVVQNVSLSELTTHAVQGVRELPEGALHARHASRAQPARRYVAQVDFVLRDHVPNEFVRVNPLGLQITYFRVDQAFEEAGR